jgi:hypothetical protein
MHAKPASEGVDNRIKRLIEHASYLDRAGEATHARETTGTDRRTPWHAFDRSAMRGCHGGQFSPQRKTPPFADYQPAAPAIQRPCIECDSFLKIKSVRGKFRCS